MNLPVNIYISKSNGLLLSHYKPFLAALEKEKIIFIDFLSQLGLDLPIIFMYREEIPNGN